jgi:protein SCO1/2
MIGTTTDVPFRTQFCYSYDHCGAQCEPLNATLRSVQDQLAQAAGEGGPVELITISFDPERDTPEALQAYA